MKTLDILGFARTALMRHRLRTVMSLLGVSIGVAAVIALSSLGDGARRYVELQFNFLGSDLLTVLPGKVETSGALPGFGRAPNDLTLEDARTLRRSLPEVQALAPVVMGNETVSNRARSRQVIVLGTTSTLQQVQDLEMEAGEFLPAGDIERGSPVAVLGRKLAKELFPGESPIGRTVRIGAYRMRVLGVLRERGVHLGADLDEMAMVPVSTAMAMFDVSSLFRILLKVGKQADLDRVKERVLSIVAERHGEEDVTVITPASVVASMAAILDVLTLALVGIAAISLSVAGIGIMNVMLVTVAERTPEIGLMKALGARPRQILQIFLTEAAALSCAGGLAGLGVSLAAIEVFRLALPEFPLTPPQWAILAALAVSLGVGLLFGVLPARKAARLDPVAALGKK